MVIKYPCLKLRGEASVGGRAIRGSECTWYLNVVNDLLRNRFRYRKRLKTELWGISTCILEAAAAAAAKSLQSCLTLRDPIDSSPPGSPIPGILQARTLEWVAISYTKNKNQFKMHWYLNVWLKTTKLLEENIVGEILDIRLAMIFWIWHQKRKWQKQKP